MCVVYSLPEDITYKKRQFPRKFIFRFVFVFVFEQQKMMSSRVYEFEYLF